jgi:UPF0271 protein
MKIDLNCDMGESFGRYTLGDDEAIMPLITSTNVACGWHAGDPSVMERTVRLAKQYGVNVGVHPSHLDLQGFGRREIDLAPEEAEAFVLYQIGALYAITKANDVELTHVKPHGALYNQAAKNDALARGIALGVTRFSKSLILVGLAGSALIHAGEAAGLRVANEGFPDRAYNADGTLMSRKLPGALMESAEQVAANALRLVQEGVGGHKVDTLCIHGDNAHASAFANAVREALQQHGILIERLS